MRNRLVFPSFLYEMTGDCCIFNGVVQEGMIVGLGWQMVKGQT